MFLLADGTKELSVTDNMGSVRFILSSQGNRQYLDYKPFGGLLYSYTGKNNRENADGSIYDEESELQMMGARMYDEETGRFTSVDPLWAAFPAQSPYSYAYNSPLTWRDPTGLAPEKEKVKEKDKDRLQSIIWDPSLIEVMWAAAMADISMQNCLLGRYSTGLDADGQPMLHGMAICAYYKPTSPGGGGSVMGGSHSGGNGGGRKAEGGSAPNGQGGEKSNSNLKSDVNSGDAKKVYQNDNSETKVLDEISQETRKETWNQVSTEQTRGSKYEAGCIIVAKDDGTDTNIEAVSGEEKRQIEPFKERNEQDLPTDINDYSNGVATYHGHTGTDDRGVQTPDNYDLGMFQTGDRYSDMPYHISYITVVPQYVYVWDNRTCKGYTFTVEQWKGKK